MDKTPFTEEELKALKTPYKQEDFDALKKEEFVVVGRKWFGKSRFNMPNKKINAYM